MDPFAQFAVAAARQAIANADLEGLIANSQKVRDATGVMIGTGNRGQQTNEAQHSNYLNRGARGVSPFAIPLIMPNAASGNGALLYELHGPSPAIVSACAAGLDATIAAYKACRDGDADAMITGGADACITPTTVASFANMGALTKSFNYNPKAASRPFDAARSGFVMAEGAAVIVLETLEFALARGAPILAEVRGYGQTNDGSHITEPSVHYQARAIMKALTNAHITPSEITLVNAHGTSTHLNDSTESWAIKAALGDYAHQVHVTSIKSMTGHPIGAAGPIELASSVLSIQHGIIPPTINLLNPDIDGGCDLNYVANTARHADVRVVLKESFGFGGHNSVLVISAYQP